MRSERQGREGQGVSAFGEVRGHARGAAGAGRLPVCCLARRCGLSERLFASTALQIVGPHGRRRHVETNGQVCSRLARQTSTIRWASSAAAAAADEGSHPPHRGLPAGAHCGLQRVGFSSADWRPDGRGNGEDGGDNECAQSRVEPRRCDCNDQLSHDHASSTVVPMPLCR